jgi:hypothetical protein
MSKEIEQDFIPYEQALALKELGFDEPCCNCSAPTFSQAFRWFREKYNLHSYITCSCSVNEILSYDWVIHKVMNNKKNKDENFITDYEQTFEEAELKCLKKLIEIVKEK